MPEVRCVDIQKIDKLRLDMGLKRSAFCQKAGIANDTYRQLDTGQRGNVKDDVIIKMARALEVKPSDLVYWVKVRPKKKVGQGA